MLVAGTLLGAGTTAHGEYRLQRWGEYIDPAKYDCIPWSKTVVIYQGDWNVFKFEAFDYPSNTPEDINLIVNYSSGEVQVMVAGQSPRWHGARNVFEIRAEGTASAIKLIGLDITGNLGADGLEPIP